MLTELRIRNFALIDQLSVELGPGLNVLTGETGAGKSIIVGAVGLLLGERASAELVRSGEERAVVEGVFDVSARPQVAALLDARGIEAEDGLLVVKREVAAEGRSRAWANGTPTTAAVLAELGEALVALHGQHEHQVLLRRDAQRAILDAYAGNEDLVTRVRAGYRAAADLEGEREELELRRRDTEQRADFLRFQAEEVERAGLTPGEDGALEEEARRLSHSEELTALAGGLHEAISSGERPLTAEVGSLRRALERLIAIDPSQAECRELFENAYYNLQELGERMERYAAGVEHDPARLEQIRRRQDVIFRLQSKYGGTIEQVLEAGRRARAELDLLDGAGFEAAALQKRLDAARAELAGSSRELTDRRGQALGRLSKEVSAVLPELGMPQGRFEAARVPLPAPGAHGAEEVEFRVALNRGFEARPLSAVASGGEMSRVMLALKTILARLDAVPTLIFDEVDAGIGGRVALQVGEKLRAVAETHQVFAITHLPQIASLAHRHLRVTKQEGAGRTTTEVAALDDAERVAEIARMLGGDPESVISREHARELLDRAVTLPGRRHPPAARAPGRPVDRSAPPGPRAGLPPGGAGG